MKKLDRPLLNKLDRLRKKKWRAALRRKQFRYSPDHRYRVVFPNRLSFTTNYPESMRCIEEVKLYGHRNTTKQIVIEIDFSQVESVTTATMLVLNSEIDRLMARRSNTVRFVLHRLHHWRPAVARQLDRLGFFNLIGVEHSIDWSDEAAGSEHTLLPMIGCDRLVPERVQSIRLRLERVATIFEQGPQIYEAMIEATDNAVRHAYSLPNELSYPPALESSWWATADYSQRDGVIKVLVFDQGAGIAATLPRWQFWERVMPLLGVLTGGQLDINDHARMIEAALEVSRTSMGSASGHGQGLRDVLSPVIENGSGSVRILSGCGGILYTPERRVERFALSQHIGGTLIQWNLPTKRGVEDDHDV